MALAAVFGYLKRHAGRRQASFRAGTDRNPATPPFWTGASFLRSRAFTAPPRKVRCQLVLRLKSRAVYLAKNIRILVPWFGALVQNILVWKSRSPASRKRARGFGAAYGRRDRQRRITRRGSKGDRERRGMWQRHGCGCAAAPCTAAVATARVLPLGPGGIVRHACHLLSGNATFRTRGEPRIRLRHARSASV